MKSKELPISEKEAAQMLGLSYSRLRALRERRQLAVMCKEKGAVAPPDLDVSPPAHRVGSRILYFKSEVNAWKSRHAERYQADKIIAETMGVAEVCERIGVCEQQLRKLRSARRSGDIDAAPKHVQVQGKHGPETRYYERDVLAWEIATGRASVEANG